MKNTLETRLGYFVAIVAAAAALILVILGGVDFGSTYKLRALFNSVQDLKVGDRVKMAGVEVGRVEDISLTNSQVLVTMKLRADAPVKTDSTASIKFTGLLGQNFVSITFGTPAAGRLADNELVTTAEQPDLNTLMTKLDNAAAGVENLTKSFTGEKIENILGPITALIRDNRESLTQTITNLSGITAQIRSGQGTIGKLIYDDTLYNSALATVTNVQSTADEIKATVADARKVVGDVSAGQGTIGKLVRDDALYRETTNSMTNLKEILQKINQGQGTVGKLINDQDLYRKAKLSLQKLDKAADGLEDQGPLSILGSMANSLF